MFRLNELLDMILSVAGKDVARIRQLLHSGTIVYHFFRYSWVGFDANETELAAALSQFPDANPSRAFAPEACTNAVWDGAGANPRHLLDLGKAAASNRRIFHRQNFWDALMEITAEKNPVYQKYSYSRRADLYRLTLDAETISRISDAAHRLASGKLKSSLRVLSDAAGILFVCPR